MRGLQYFPTGNCSTRWSDRALFHMRISHVEIRLVNAYAGIPWPLEDMAINFGSVWASHMEAKIYSLDFWMFWPGCACFNPYFFSSSSVFFFCIWILAVTSLPLLFSFLPIC